VTQRAYLNVINYFVQLEGEAAWDSVMAAMEDMKLLANSHVVFLASVESV